VAEFALNLSLTGQLIDTGGDGEPFNYMIGPGPLAWIRSGARFVPCIRSTSLNFQIITLSSAPNATAYTISELCGLGGFPPNNPNQWFRLFLPIILHGGIIHLLFNAIVEWRVMKSLELEYGPTRIAAIFFISGYCGFVFGGIVSPIDMVSLGASGAIFGVIATLLIEILQRWREIPNPKRELGFLIFIIILSFAFGLIPGMDNFAHIGGFMTGLAATLAMLPTRGLGWWWKGLRVLGWLATLAVVLTLTLEFFNGQVGTDVCSWCKYLSCVPINGGCDAFNPANTTTSS